MRLVLAIDIETTGRRFGRDEILAVGWAGGVSVSPGKIQVRVEPRRFGFDVRKPSGASWAEHWKARGWSAWNFWGDRTELLDELQRGALPPAEALEQIDRALGELESRFELVPVVDAVGYDLAWLNTALAAAGYEDLAHTRSGKGRRCLDAYSFLLGRGGFGYEEAAVGHNNGGTAFRAYLDGIIHELPPGEYKHPHLPEQDAYGVLLEFLGARP